jgi:hypothetical protein
LPEKEVKNYLAYLPEQVYNSSMNKKAPAEIGVSTGARLSRTTEAEQGLCTLIVRLQAADSKRNPHDLSQLPYHLF